VKVTTTLKSPSGGLLSDLLQQDLAQKKLAFKLALAKSARGLEQDLEDGLRAAGVPKLAPMLASVAYPKEEGKGSFNAQAVVYLKAGPQWQEVVSAAVDGATIRAHGGRFLAVPIGAHPRATTPGALGWSPRMMVESGAAFVRRRKSGPGYIWFLRVADRRPPGALGRKVVISSALMRRASGRRGAVMAVPMFLLIPEIVLKARVNGPALIARRFGEIQTRYDDEFRRLTLG
jgi:hypothetical protein